MPSLPHPILEAFVRFRATWPRRGWSFDNRFDCVASSFATDFAPEAKVLLAPLLPHAFTERTLPTAPALVSAIASRTGGIRSTQLIFAGDPVGRLTPYGLWWPWEEGQTISLRLGLEGATEELQRGLCDVFGAV